MQEHFYHYTSKNNAARILGLNHNEERTGLGPRKRFIRYGLDVDLNLPAKAHDGGVFGLLEPVPSSWATEMWCDDTPAFQDVLDDISGEGRVLFEVAVNPEDDIYIGEWGMHLADDYNGLNGSNSNILKRVKEDYFNSLCPWQQYFEEGREYNLPEVVCFTPINKDNISIKLIFDEAYDAVNAFRAKTGLPLRFVSKAQKERQELGTQAFLDSLGF